MLRVKTLDMGDPQSLLDQALSPPNRERIAHTVLVLKEVCFLLKVIQHSACLDLI